MACLACQEASGESLGTTAGQPSQKKARELGTHALFFTGGRPSSERLQTIAQLIDEGGEHLSNGRYRLFVPGKRRICDNLQPYHPALHVARQHASLPKDAIFFLVRRQPGGDARRVK
jgi:hypothetical protein